MWWHADLHEALIASTSGLGGFISGMWFRTRQLAWRERKGSDHEQH